MKNKSPELILESLVNDISKSFAEWDNIKVNGCFDPSWPDGTNMNLIHNHICYYKKQIQQICQTSNLPLPDIYNRATPPEVSNDYMARVDDIRTAARNSLLQYKQDPSFALLAQVAYNISDNKKSKALGILRYMKGLETAIQKDDLVTMRRHYTPENYMRSAHDFVTTLQEQDYYGQQSFLGLL